MKSLAMIKDVLRGSIVLGGSPCSGKSTLAERLSADFHLPYYKADDHMWRHLEQADLQTQPTMAVYSKKSWDEIWSQPVDKQVKDVFAYYTEQFSMILNDLMDYRNQESIIIEGVAFIPELVHELGIKSDRVLFLVPTKDFQIDHYSKRPWVKPILESCADPDQVFANWMDRDHRFGLIVLEQAMALGYSTILVDGQKNVDMLYSQVLEHFDWLTT